MSGWSLSRGTAVVARVGRVVMADPLLSLEALALRAATPLLKRAVPIGTLARYMWQQPSIDAAATAARVEHLRGFDKYAGRIFVSTNCLERSLLLYRTLSRAGASPVLVLGATQGTATLDGHAWVELDGEAVNDPTALRYAPVVSFGARGERLSAERVRSAA